MPDCVLVEFGVTDVEREMLGCDGGVDLACHWLVGARCCVRRMVDTHWE